jgi:DNA polymerase
MDQIGQNELLALSQECLACRRCQIGGQLVDGKFLSNVLSNMNLGVKVMAIGQNPGRLEIERKEPFVGTSGKLFDKALLEIVGLKRSDLYIGNCVRCFTPHNRKPFQQEEDNCREFLDKEIAIVKPEIIVALGSLAFKQLTGMSGIMRHHGEIIPSIRYKIPVIPILHPSPLNTNNPERREGFYNDLRKLKEFLDGHRV